LALLGVSLLLAGVLAGCGSESSDSDEESEAIGTAQADVSFVPGRTTPGVGAPKSVGDFSTLIRPVALDARDDVDGDGEGDQSDGNDDNHDPSPNPWRGGARSGAFDGDDTGIGPNPVPWSVRKDSMHDH